MNEKRQQSNKAFTIIELLVAIALLAILLVWSSIVFQHAINSERVARATSEVARKLQAITEQIDLDFSTLQKNGEIMLLWVPSPVYADGDNTLLGYERLDRIMFYTTGIFASYNEYPTISGTPPRKIVNGNIARVCYTFGRDASDTKPQFQNPADRILLRTQHIYTSDSDIPLWPVMGLPNGVGQQDQFAADYFTYEYDTQTLTDWMAIPYSTGFAGGKAAMLSIITGVGVGPVSPGVPLGPMVDIDDPFTIHMVFSEGVGSFSIQGWYYDDGNNNPWGKFAFPRLPVYRWFPMMDPDGDGDLTNDSDFRLNGAVIHPDRVPGLLYPAAYGGHVMGPYPPNDGGTTPQYPASMLNQANFNNIPGLGRALKFTFTLYDSRGIFKDGKTFTHIVYLDN